MIGKITKRTAEGLRPGQWLWDSGVTGFGAKRSKGGVFYYLRYRIGGTQHFTSIGKHGSSHTPETARREAQRLLGQIATGADPAAQRNAPAPETFGAAMERYLTHKRAQLRPRSFTEIDRHLRQHARSFHRQPLSEINRRAIAQRLGEVETGSGSVARNRVRSSLSAMFDWAIREGLLEVNPVAMTASAVERTRERVLSPAELGKLWHALGTGHFADIVRLLILTGQRRDEIGDLQWSEIEAEGPTSSGIAKLTLSPARTKNNRAHVVPLSPQALAIVQRQPRRDRPFLFGRSGHGYSGWSD